MALERRWMPSPNYSSRGGSGVRLIVLHTAEGATTIESLGNFFASSSAGVSSHTGADDKLGVIGEYVHRPNKAWTASNANPVAVQIEMCAFAAWTLDQWNQHPNMLRNCADWIAEEAAAFGIPIVKLNAQQAQSNGRGVCQHADLGSWGGGHWDCGSGFPIDRVIQMAQGGAPAPEPEPTPPPEDEDVANYTICAATGDPKQYITDLATFKRPINGENDWNSTVWCTVASGAKLYYNADVNNPVRVPPETLNQLPEVHG